jgi:acyl-CoA thioesterase-2
MSEALANLLSMMELESTGQDTYRGLGPGGSRRRMFGGHVAGQALMAAGRTAPDRCAHSLHAYFLRPGDANQPIEFRVQRLRDGKSFTTRVVTASQQGEAILHASVSFHADEPGFEHQRTAPEVPPPEACIQWDAWMEPRLAQLSPTVRAQMVRERPIELRPIDPIDMRDPVASGRFQHFWFRAPAAMPDDALLHQSLATYASDHALLSAVMRPHGRTFLSTGIMAASLDHSLWFHRPFRMDQWLLYAQETPAACAARGLAFGHVFDRQGVLVASVAQEGLVRAR